MEKTISIIGAGMSGLAAGCYGQMNGYRTRIFEMHNKPGGMCTAWERKGYNIGTPGWLMGSGPANNDFYRFWEELGALQGRTFIDYEALGRIEGRDGQVLVLYTDIDRLEQHMLELAPEDGELIAGFAKALHTMTGFKMPLDKAPELSSALDKIKMMVGMLPYMLGPMGKWMQMTLGNFAKQFKNPFLREALGGGLSEILFSAPDAGLTMVLSTLALMHRRAAGYPLGGFLDLARAIEQRYRDLGGEIHYGSRVDKILVEADPSGQGNRAVGVRVPDGPGDKGGAEYHSDIVISAADGHTTIFGMLEGRYVTDQIRGYYDELALYPPILHIALGVDRSFEEELVSVVGDVFPLEEPVSIAGRDFEWLVPDIPSFDPSLAPEGKSLVKLRLPTDYGYWRDLRDDDRQGYKDEQEKVAGQVIALLDGRYPGFAGQVEMVDVATPVSFERFTGCWQGGWMGWVATPESLTRQMSKTLPGLESFYMVGTWVGNSSLPYAATSGRHAIQIICHGDKRSFVTTVP
jgi:phytoene dehydrogenase-like protein